MQTNTQQPTVKPHYKLRLDGSTEALGVHPEDIKAALRKQGVTPSALAEKLEVSSGTMSQVISGRAVSARIRTQIALIVGKPVDAIWPPKPSLRRSRQILKGATA